MCSGRRPQAKVRQSAMPEVTPTIAIHQEQVTDYRAGCCTGRVRKSDDLCGAPGRRSPHHARHAGAQGCEDRESRHMSNTTVSRMTLAETLIPPHDEPKHH